MLRTLTAAAVGAFALCALLVDAAFAQAVDFSPVIGLVNGAIRWVADNPLLAITSLVTLCASLAAAIRAPDAASRWALLMKAVNLVGLNVGQAKNAPPAKPDAAKTGKGATVRSLVAALALVLGVPLAGCGLTPEGALIRDTVAAKGAQAYDEGLENAEWFICNAASIGAVRRKYGRDPKSAETYTNLCSPSIPPDIITAKPQ